MGALKRFDRFQQRNAPLAFIVGVAKKFADDQAGHLAALISYYAFFSLLPLLLTFVTLLGFALQGDPHLQAQVRDSVLRNLPGIGDQIRRDVHSLRGSTAALVVGISAAVWIGLGLSQAAQSAFNRVWNVPHKHRPNFLVSRLRGVVLLTVLGILLLGSSILTGFAAGGGPLAPATGIVGSVLVNLILFGAAFRLLTSDEVTLRELLPGIVLAALFWQVLVYLGGAYVSAKLTHAHAAYGIYGIFLTVLGLQAALYLAAQATLLAAEINVVRVRHLWPRSLFSPLVEGDRRALRFSAEVEERVQGEEVQVTFTER